MLLCVWAERAFLGSAKTAFKFKYEIKVVQLHKVERKEGTSAQGQLILAQPNCKYGKSIFGHIGSSKKLPQKIQL